MKKYLATLMTLILFIGLVPVEVFAQSNTSMGTVYYVDSESGNDEKDGKTEKNSWKTLKNVNSTELKPGDKVLFKANSVFTGVLSPKGSGVEGAPIIIDMYGEGNKPAFIGEEKSSHTVYLFNQEYIELNNLDISANYTNELERRGVYIQAEDKGTVNHIYLKNLDIHDVQINKKYVNSNSYKTSGGIFVQITGNTTPTKFDDLLIENCTIQDVDRTGIQLLWSSWANRSSSNMGSGRWYPSTNVVVRNNYVKSTAGDGIVVQSTDGAIIEHNTIDDFASRNQGLAYNCAAWSHNADNTVFQFNEGMNGNTTKDGMPWDSDGYSYGTIYQYNYSHNNEGGAYLIISYGDNASSTKYADSRDSIFRYNISENDRFALMTMTNPLGNNKIYNNVFYVGPERSVDAFFYGSMNSKDIGVNLTNNIFYVDSKDGKNGSLGGNWGDKFNYDNNIYYSKNDKGITRLPKDKNKITEDPKFIAPGSGENGYKIQEDSPAINTGKYIVDNGGIDYYGNSLYNGIPDIGVHEYSDKAFDIPVGENNNLDEMLLNNTLEREITKFEETIKYRWRDLNGQANNITEMEVVSTRNNNTTIFESAVPWKQLLPEGIVPTVDSVLGLSLALNDTDDGTGRESWMEFNGGIASGGKNPAKYGDLYLKNGDFVGEVTGVNPVVALKVDVKPTLDGNLEDWNKSSESFSLNDSEQAFVEIDKQIINDANWTSEDLSAKAYLRWDNENLYIALEVLDNKQVQLQVANPRAMWNNDSVQIGIDPDRTDSNDGDSQRTEFGFAHYEEFIDDGKVENLVQNGDFESKQVIGTVAVKNEWYKNGSDHVGEIADTYKNGGNFGLKVANRPGAGTFVNYQPNLKVDTNYKVSYDAKKVAGAPNPLKIKFFDPMSSSNGGYDGGAGAQLNNEWNNYSFEFRTGESFKAGEPPMLFIASTPNGEIWVDNVEIKEVTGDGGPEEPDVDVTVDLTKVKELLEIGDTMVSSIVIGENIGETPKMAADRLSNAVRIANEVVKYEFAGVNKTAEIEIIELLETSIDAAERCKVTENTGNFDKEPGVTISDIAIAISYMGQERKVFNNLWTEAKRADLDGNDKVDFVDLEKIANKILKNKSEKANIENSKVSTYKDAEVGDTLKYIYELENVSDIVAQDMKVNFNNEVLEIVSVNTTYDYEGASIAKGKKKNYHVLGSNINDGVGRFILGADAYRNALNIETDAPVKKKGIMEIVFKVVGAGTTDIIIDDTVVDTSITTTDIRTTLEKDMVIKDNSTLDPEEEIVIQKITNLKYNANSKDVKLTWGEPSSMVGVTGYVIYEDGKELDVVNTGTQEYIATKLRANTNYGFKVVTKYSNGKLSKPVSINARTKK